MNVEIGTLAAQILFWEYICFKFSVLVLCSLLPKMTSGSGLSVDWDCSRNENVFLNFRVIGKTELNTLSAERSCSLLLLDFSYYCFLTKNYKLYNKLSKFRFEAKTNFTHTVIPKKIYCLKRCI